MIIDKQAFVQTYYDLFARGEMMKAHKLVNECVPLPLEDDPDIVNLRTECNNRIEEIKRWNQNGRMYPGRHASIPNPLDFPKFKLAYDKIREQEGKMVLDVGCYAGDFIKLLAKEGYSCCGVDLHEELMQKLNGECDGNPRFYFCNSESLSDVLLRDQFDVVMLFDVLEHCFFPEVVLSSVDEVAKDGALVIINLPRTSIGYTDEAFEHLHMFSDHMIQDMFGSRKNFKFEFCEDEIGNPTSFITYNR